MAGSYSRDLRGRVLAAVEAGESVEAAAERFVVGRSTAYRWVTAARAEGRREAKPSSRSIRVTSAGSSRRAAARRPASLATPVATGPLSSRERRA
jgi:transposase-like protein